MLSLLLRRLWLVALLGVVAGATAYWLTRDTADTYEHTAVFVLRPAAQVDDTHIPDAVRGIASQDSQLVQTITRVIETDRFLELAFDDALDREPIEGYTLTSSKVPGSDLIEVDLAGPDPDVLGVLAESFADEATEWVDDVYRAYALDLLEIRTPETPVSVSPGQTIALAVLLGLLLGVGVVYAEWRAAQRARAPQLSETGEVPVEPEPAVARRARRIDRAPAARAAEPVELRGAPRPGERPRSGQRRK